MKRTPEKRDLDVKIAKSRGCVGSPDRKPKGLNPETRNPTPLQFAGLGGFQVDGRVPKP